MGSKAPSPSIPRCPYTRAEPESLEGRSEAASAAPERRWGGTYSEEARREEDIEKNVAKVGGETLQSDS